MSIDAGNQADLQEQTSECHRKSCRLSLSESGNEVCLMEYVRQLWSNLFAANYCKDSSCMKFFDQIHRT